MQRIVTPIKEFIKDSRAIGIVLLTTTLLSIAIANSNGYNAVVHILHQPICLFKPLHLPESLWAWINDFLMGFYFLLVGLEIKRAFIIGELRSRKAAVAPIVAAIGGMLAPALIYYFITQQTIYTQGWGIPMATDIAFSLGVLSLLSKRIPISVKIFLMALAIIDDLGGILVIALFYSQTITYAFLLLSMVLLFILWKWQGYLKPLFNILLSFAIWYCIHRAGIHGTIAGILVAWCLPLSSAAYIEHKLHDFTSFIILPLFVFANTLLPIPSIASFLSFNTMQLGIIYGLTIGKPVGILLFLALGILFGWCQLPNGANWKHLLIVGIIAGIGFTISLFISQLAFTTILDQQAAIIAILVSFCISLMSTFLAYQFVKRRSK